MIVYFADRAWNILATASTSLPNGLRIIDDLKTEEVEVGVATFSAKLLWTEKERLACKQAATVGNYVMVERGGLCEGYTIVETEEDTTDGSVFFSAEDAGMELLNEVAISWPHPNVTANAMTLTEYFTLWLYDTGFEIGNNDATGDSTTKQQGYDESTTTERLLKTAEDFGYEIGYSFAISLSEMAVTHKYVDIYKKRGSDTGVQLKLNYEVNGITTKTNADNIATSLLVYGTEITGTSNPQTLDGYTYDDGDFVVANQYFAARQTTHACLQSRTALERWGRLVNGTPQHLTQAWHDETTNVQSKLCENAIKELKKRREAEVNYEVDISRPPDGINIGDTIRIIDDGGELYLSARVLKIEHSECNDSTTLTLGDYLIKGSGISAKVEALAEQFSKIASVREVFTWIAYADDDQGTNISLSPYNKAYMGISVNQSSETPVITDPTIFSWFAIDAGSVLALAVEITSSAGQVFITTTVDTTLTAHVYLNGEELTTTQIADIGTIRWYDVDDLTTVLGTGQTYTITQAMNINAINIRARLEVD